MIIQINMAGETPIYLQIRNQIVLAVGRGDIPVGGQIPTVRQLAGDLGINAMTVNKAYALLKNEGFIEIDRRHGAKIAGFNMNSKEFPSRLKENLSLIVTEAYLKGCKSTDILEVFQSVIAGLNVQTFDMSFKKEVAL